MYSIAILFSGGAAIAVVALTHTGVLPIDMMQAWVIAGVFVLGILQTLWWLSRRSRTWSAYRDAGFEVGPATDSVTACSPFPFAHGYKDRRYWLPEAPEVHVYDCEEDGAICGHLITLPTSAPDGVGLWGVGRNEVAGWVNHVIYDELGLRKAGEPPELQAAMPTVAGVLVVWRGAAHWLHRGKLDPSEIRAAITALRRLPRAATPSAARHVAAISQE